MITLIQILLKYALALCVIVGLFFMIVSTVLVIVSIVRKAGDIHIIIESNDTEMRKVNKE